MVAPKPPAPEPARLLLEGALPLLPVVHSRIWLLAVKQMRAPLYASHAVTQSAAGCAPAAGSAEPACWDALPASCCACCCSALGLPVLRLRVPGALVVALPAGAVAFIAAMLSRPVV